MKKLKFSLLALSVLAGGALISSAAPKPLPAGAAYPLNVQFTTNPPVLLDIGALPTPSTNPAVLKPGDSGVIATDGSGKIDGVTDITTALPGGTNATFIANISGSITTFGGAKATNGGAKVAMTLKGNGFAVGPNNPGIQTPATMNLTFKGTTGITPDGRVVDSTKPGLYIKLNPDGITTNFTDRYDPWANTNGTYQKYYTYTPLVDYWETNGLYTTNLVGVVTITNNVISRVENMPLSALEQYRFTNSLGHVDTNNLGRFVVNFGTPIGAEDTNHWWHLWSGADTNNNPIYTNINVVPLAQSVYTTNRLVIVSPSLTISNQTTLYTTNPPNSPPTANTTHFSSPGYGTNEGDWVVYSNTIVGGFTNYLTLVFTSNSVVTTTNVSFTLRGVPDDVADTTPLGVVFQQDYYLDTWNSSAVTNAVSPLSFTTNALPAVLTSLIPIQFQTNFGFNYLYKTSDNPDFGSNVVQAVPFTTNATAAAITVVTNQANEPLLFALSTSPGFPTNNVTVANWVTQVDFPSTSVLVTNNINFTCIASNIYTFTNYVTGTTRTDRGTNYIVEDAFDFFYWAYDRGVMSQLEDPDSPRPGYVITATNELTQWSLAAADITVHVANTFLLPTNVVSYLGAPWLRTNGQWYYVGITISSNVVAGATNFAYTFYLPTAGPTNTYLHDSYGQWFSLNSEVLSSGLSSSNGTQIVYTNLVANYTAAFTTNTYPTNNVFFSILDQQTVWASAIATNFYAVTITTNWLLVTNVLTSGADIAHLGDFIKDFNQSQDSTTFASYSWVTNFELRPSDEGGDVNQFYSMGVSKLVLNVTTNEFLTAQGGNLTNFVEGMRQVMSNGWHYLNGTLDGTITAGKNKMTLKKVPATFVESHILFTPVTDAPPTEASYRLSEVGGMLDVLTKSNLEAAVVMMGTKLWTSSPLDSDDWGDEYAGTGAITPAKNTYKATLKGVARMKGSSLALQGATHLGVGGYQRITAPAVLSITNYAATNLGSQAFILSVTNPVSGILATNINNGQPVTNLLANGVEYDSYIYYNGRDLAGHSALLVTNGNWFTNWVTNGIFSVQMNGKILGQTLVKNAYIGTNYDATFPQGTNVFVPAPVTYHTTTNITPYGWPLSWPFGPHADRPVGWPY